MKIFHSIKKNDIARAYRGLPSLAAKLPWRDFNEKHKCILLEDNESVGVAFKITPIACEARPDAMLNEIAKSIAEALLNTIPCEKENPWVLQFYVQKDSCLSSAYAEVENYFLEKRKPNTLTESFLKDLAAHFEYVSNPGGIFHDSQVTNQSFRGGLLKVYATLYRRKSKNPRRSTLDEMTLVSRKFIEQMRASGIHSKRMDAQEFYHWMASWFNPKPRTISYSTKNDLAEQLFFSVPESFDEGWLFDGLPHKLITIQCMTMAPEVGHLTAERKRVTDDKVFNFVDQLPEGSTFVLNVVLQAQSEVERHLKSIQASVVGNHAQAIKVKDEITIAEKSIAHGNPLFPLVMGVYLKGESLDDLHAKESQLEVLLNSNGFKVITGDELFPVDAYLRYLPMCYDFHFDRKYSKRYRYVQLSDIVKLLPVYGRSRGTEHPAIVMFNRGGEPWFYDLMADRTKNAHFLLLGETGTGKSNLLNYLVMQDLALYGSRFFIIDAGGSFDLLGDYCKSLGLIVNKIKIDPRSPVSLNPFAYGLKVIEQIEEVQGNARKHFLENACDKLITEQTQNKTQDEIDDAPRDILGDMVLAALIMITGGEKREEEAIRRSDRMIVMDAIIHAAYYVRDQGRDQMIASDIVDAFGRLVLNDPDKSRRAREMADAMRYFTNDPVSSRFFNAPGKPWEQADVTIVDFGLFANEGYEAQRSIAFAGCMNKILALAELNQNSDRAIKVILDENHIFTSISLLADIETRIAKMGRKLGLWLWLATQNLKDFADNSRRMLAQIEHWMCLALPPDEIDQIEKFKSLSTEIRALLLSARKEKGKYTEGVLISPKLKALFRNVPPKLYLAMAATDQDEKNHRARIMQELSCSEIEAVSFIAKEMMRTKQSAEIKDF